MARSKRSYIYCSESKNIGNYCFLFNIFEKTGNRAHPLSAVVRCALSLLSGPVFAISSNDWSASEASEIAGNSVYVSEQYSDDDNIFRLPTMFSNLASNATPGASRQDHIKTLSFGTEDQFEYGRQSVKLNLELDQSDFLQNRYMNNTSGVGDVYWAWGAGNALSGDVGADYQRAIANSAQTLFYGKDLVGTTTGFTDARFEVVSNWALTSGFRAIDTSNSAVEVQVNNFHSKSANAGVEYSGKDGDLVNLDYRHTEARAVQQEITGGFDNQNYNENSTRLILKYLVDDKTSIDVSGGYLERNYPRTALGAFAGGVWRADLYWHPTDKTGVTISTWRDLTAYVDAQSNYFVARGESVSPIWVASEKLKVSASILWINQDYIASNPNMEMTGERRDHVLSQQVSLDYFPVRDIQIKLAYSSERHSSTIALFEYADQLWACTFRVMF